MKGHMHSNHKHQSSSSSGSGNSSSSGNNSSSSAGNIKEAERRLGAILKTAQKLSVSPDDLSRLMAVRKLTQNTARCRSCSRHVLPLLAGLITVLMVLVMYSVEEQGLGCVKNTSESSVSTTKDATPGAPHPAGAPRQRNRDTAEQGHQNDPVTSSPTERWVTSRGQLLRRER